MGEGGRIQRQVFLYICIQTVNWTFWKQFFTAHEFLTGTEYGKRLAQYYIYIHVLWNVQFTVCMHKYGELASEPPLPIFPTKKIVISYSCDDLLRKLQWGVCIFSFSFFYHLCGSYYVHSNIVNILKGKHTGMFFKLSRFQHFLAFPFFIRFTLEFTWCLTFRCLTFSS